MKIATELLTITQEHQLSLRLANKAINVAKSGNKHTLKVCVE